MGTCCSSETAVSEIQDSNIIRPNLLADNNAEHIEKKISEYENLVRFVFSKTSQICLFFKVYISIAFMTKGKDLPCLFLLLQAIQVSDLLNSLQGLLDEVVKNYPIARKKLIEELPLLLSVNADLQHRIPGQLRKLKDDVTNTIDIASRLHGEFSALEPTSGNVVELARRGTEVVDDLNLLKAKRDENLAILNSTLTAFKAAQSSVLSIYHTMDPEHMKKLLMRAYISFMTTVSVAKSQMAASAALGVSLGQELNEKLSTFASHIIPTTGAGREYNWVVSTLLPPLCMAATLFFSFFFKEYAFVFSIGKSSGDVFVQSVIDPLAEKFELPHLKGNAFLSTQIQAILIAVIFTSQIANSGPGFLSTTFWPVFVAESALLRFFASV